jgi:hypothetical protein
MIPFTIKEMDIGRKGVADEPPRKGPGILLFRCIGLATGETFEPSWLSTIGTTLFKEEPMDPISEQLIGLFCGDAVETPLFGWDRLLWLCFTGHGCRM